MKKSKQMERYETFKALVKKSGLQYWKIAEILNLSVNTVQSYMVGRLTPTERVIRIMDIVNDALDNIKEDVE